jgi:ketosteroid isomerase-like protein
VLTRVFFATVILLNAATLAAQSAQETPPLETAERALVNALLRPDAEAFRQLLAADAVFSVPAQVQGADAIVEKWQPFLKGGEVRLSLTIDSSTTAQSGERGQTLGTFAVYGRTLNGMSTTPVGAVSIAWRVIDGRWKIETLSRTGKAAKQRAAN